MGPFLLAVIIYSVQINGVFPHCNCDHFIYEEDIEEGVIKSPNYPRNYCNNLDCTYEIEPRSDMGIALEIESFSMEGEHDFLTVHQYEAINNTQHKVFFGRWSGLRGIAGHYFTVRKGVGLSFHMTTDTSDTFSGFKMTFSRTNDSESICPYPFLRSNFTPTTLPLNKTLFDSDCVYRIQAEEGQHIVLNMSSPYSDYVVEVRESGETEIAATSNSKHLWISTGSAIDLDLPSKSSYRASHDAPTIQYYTLDYDPCKCDSKTVVLKGNDSVSSLSPGFPNQFCASFGCEATFELEPAETEHQLAVFHVIINYLSSDSTKDSMVFKFGDQSMSYSAKDYFNNERTFVSKILKATFTSSQQMTNHGYNMTVQRILVPHDCVCSIGKTMRSEGSIALSIPSYCTQMDCIYEIPSSRWSKLFRMVLRLELNTDGDQLEIESRKQKLRYTYEDGAKKFERLTLSPAVQIRFQRNMEDPQPAGKPTNLNITWAPITYCACDLRENTATSEWNQLTSPNYPNDYCDDVDCVHNIRAEEGYRLVLNISEFDTEPYTDHLEVLNWNSEKLYEFAGRKVDPIVLIENNNTVSLHFKTDHSVTRKGFIVHYKAEPIEE